MTDAEKKRMETLIARDVVKPVPRSMIPKDTLASFDEHGEHASMFLVVPDRFFTHADSQTVMIIPEGSWDWQKYLGLRFDDPPCVACRNDWARL